MPDFQASLIDSATSAIDVSLDTECSILTVEDNSNYTLSDEVGHENADFADYRQMILTSPDGDTYGWDSLGNLDEAWTPGNSGNNTLNRTLDTTDEDGVYVFTLYSVPTWNDGDAYDHTTANPTCIYYDGKLYKSLQAVPANTVPDASPTFWDEITNEDLTSKYCTTATFALTCRNLLQCLEEKTRDAVCVCEADDCDDDLLCTNHHFLQAVKLKTVLDGIDYASANSDFCEATNLINYAKSICNC